MSDEEKEITCKACGSIRSKEYYTNINKDGPYCFFCIEYKNDEEAQA